MHKAYSLLLIIFSTIIPTAHAGYLRVVSGAGGEAIPNVAVCGLRSNQTWLSDSLGIVRIPHDDPGPFRFSHLSFQTRILKPDTGAGLRIITLQPLPYSLNGIVVLSPLARFRRDSAFNHSFFRRELADAKFKPGKKLIFIHSPLGVQVGVQWGGVLSNVALVASGKKARYRKFARNLKRYETEKFAAIRYTTSLVSEQTGLEEDSAFAFIASHPLDDEFLRSATELELKMRVRELYRTGQ